MGRIRHDSGENGHETEVVLKLPHIAVIDTPRKLMGFRWRKYLSASFYVEQVFGPELDSALPHR